MKEIKGNKGTKEGYKERKEGKEMVRWAVISDMHGLRAARFGPCGFEVWQVAFNVRE